MRIQGDVRLSALVDTDGTIARLRLMSGHPLLVKAAMDAARQYVYRLQSKPAIATIVITFHISFGAPRHATRV